MKLAKIVVLTIGTSVVAFVTAAFINTALTPSRQLQVTPVKPAPVDEQRAVARLAAAIRKQTIASASDPAQNKREFLALHEQLAADYPLAHQTLQREAVNETALLYRWQGLDNNAPAIVLMAHMDVVPVAPGTEKDWRVPAFDGAVKDGFVWGRGAWDDKGNLIAQLEAVEALLARGFKPVRTIYLSYGADEEVGGERGAKVIAGLLKARGVRAEFVLDEGLLITDGIMPGLDAPAALIGIAEKGYVSTKLTVIAEPGHSSMPPPDKSGAVIKLSEILLRLRDDPMPAAMTGAAREMLGTLAPEMHGIRKVILTNLWLFEPLVNAQLTQAPETNAMLRTTTAFTMLAAGNADNVLPGRASATLNFRLLPGDSSTNVVAHVRRHAAAVLPAERFVIDKLAPDSEASSVSPTAGSGYQAIARALRELEPGTVVAPGLMLGATDSRYFRNIGEQIYRFSAIHARKDDLARFHGTNERLAISDLATMIRFYQRVIELSAGG